MHRVLVPLDGSVLAARVVPYAGLFARLTHRGITLVQIHDGVELPTTPAALHATAAELRAEGTPVEIVVASRGPGPVAAAIQHLGQTRGSEVLALSTRGQGGLGEWLFGTIAEQLLRAASMPVLLVSPATSIIWPATGPRRVLLPMDGSPPALRLAQRLLATLDPLRPELLLLRVVSAPHGGAAGYMLMDLTTELESAQAEMESVGERLRVAGWTLRVAVAAGAAASTIVNVARTAAVDLIAMPTHGRSGLAGLLLGSVAAETVKQTAAPVLLIRPELVAQPADGAGPATTRSPGERGA